MFETHDATPGQKLDAKLLPYVTRRRELTAQMERDRHELERIAQRLADAEYEQAQLDEQMLDAARELAGEDGFFAALLTGGEQAEEVAPAIEADDGVEVAEVPTITVEPGDRAPEPDPSVEQRAVQELSKLLGSIRVPAPPAPAEGSAEAAAERIRSRLARQG